MIKKEKKETYKNRTDKKSKKQKPIKNRTDKKTPDCTSLATCDMGCATDQNSGDLTWKLTTLTPLPPSEIW